MCVCVCVCVCCTYALYFVVENDFFETSFFSGRCMVKASRLALVSRCRGILSSCVSARFSLSLSLSLFLSSLSSSLFHSVGGRERERELLRALVMSNGTNARILACTLWHQGKCLFGCVHYGIVCGVWSHKKCLWGARMLRGL